MRVQLNLSNGSLSGHRFTIRERQRVSIGSTQWAEICLADEDISEVQCVINCDGESCLLTNLEHEIPVFVNGVSVARKSLVNGDIISVGRTVLAVSIDSEKDGHFSSMGIQLAGHGDVRCVHSESIISRPAHAVEPVLACVEPVPDEISQCQMVQRRSRGVLTEFCSGITCHRGASAADCPIKLAREMDRRYRMHLLADVAALETIVSDFPDAVPILCDSQSDEPAISVVSPELNCDRFAMLEQLWGKGLATAVFCNDRTESIIPTLAQSLPWLLRSAESQLDSLQKGVYPEILMTIDAILVDHSRSNEWLLITAPGVE